MASIFNNIDVFTHTAVLGPVFHLLDLVLLFLLHTIVIIKSCMIYCRLVCGQMFFSLSFTHPTLVFASLHISNRYHAAAGRSAETLGRCSESARFCISGKEKSLGAFLSSHFADFLGFEIVCIVWSGRGVGWGGGLFTE